METIDAQSAVPTMFNSFIEYSGTLTNTGALTDGTSSEVPISTEIRQDLHVDAMCRENDVLVPRIFQAFWKKSLGAANVAIVTIEVPSGCTCVYRISGNKELTQPHHAEQGQGVGTVGNQHAGGHRHDGNDSKKVSYNNLLDIPSALVPDAANAGKFLKTSSGPVFEWKYTPNAESWIFNIATLPAVDNWMLPPGEEGRYIYRSGQLWGVYLSQNAGATQGLIDLQSSPVGMAPGNYAIKVSDSGGGEWRVDLLIYTGGAWTNFYMITDNYVITPPFTITLNIQYSSYTQDH